MLYKEIYNAKKKWIVLLHCVCGNEKIFNDQMAMLKKYYNIAIFRLAGHKITSFEYEATFDYVIEEIHKFALEKRTKIDLFGVSLGAMISTKYLSKYPNDVDNAYLVGNIYGFSVPFFKIGYLLLTKVNNLIPRNLYMYFITKFILPGKQACSQRKKLYNYSLKMKPEFLYLWMSEMGKFIIKGEEYLKLTLSSKTNIKLIYGQRDNMFLGWVKRRIKGKGESRLYVIKNSGHLCNMDSPKSINTIIKEDNHEELGCN